MIIDPLEYIEANLQALAEERVVMINTNDHTNCPYFCRLMSILSPEGAPVVDNPVTLAASLVDQHVVQRFAADSSYDGGITTDEHVMDFSQTLYRKIYSIKVLDQSKCIDLLHDYLGFLEGVGIRTGADNWPVLDANVTNESNITAYKRWKNDPKFVKEYEAVRDDWNTMRSAYTTYYDLVARYNNPGIAQHDIIQPFRDISDTVFTLITKSKGI